MDELWTLRAAKRASQAQQGLFKAELECPACDGSEKVHNHDQPGDGEDTGRTPIVFLAVAFLLAGFVAAMLVLLW